MRKLDSRIQRDRGSDGEEVFRCPWCRVNFADAEAANDHANRNHDAKYEYKCRHCSRTSNSSLEMTEHYSKKHGKDLKLAEKDGMRSVRYVTRKRLLKMVFSTRCVGSG